MAHEDALGLAQVVLALLIFALGVPALTLASVEERLRYLLYKYPQHRVVTWLMVFMLVFVLALLASVHGTNASAVRPPLLSWLTATIAVDAGLAFDVARGLLMLLVISFGLFWLSALRVDTRARLVADLVRRSVRVLQRRGYLPQEALGDLVVIGECAEGGHDKELVLRGLDNLCAAAQEHSRYVGTDLEPLMDALGKILGARARPGNDANYITAIRLVRRCWGRLQPSELCLAADRKAVVEIACVVSELAVANCSAMVAAACVDTVVDEPRVSFKLGVAALQAELFPVAVAALSRLETLAESNGSALRLLLALAARFETHGESATRVANECRARLGQSAAQLADAAKEAVASFYRMSDFANADLVRLKDRRGG